MIKYIFKVLQNNKKQYIYTCFLNILNRNKLLRINKIYLLLMNCISFLFYFINFFPTHSMSNTNLSNIYLYKIIN